MKKLLSLFLVVTMFAMLSATFVYAAGSGTAIYKFTPDKTDVNGGETVNIAISVTATSFPVQYGTITIETSSNKCFTYGKIKGVSDVTWEDNGNGKYSFKIGKQRLLEGETLGILPITCSEPQFDVTEQVVGVKEVTMTTWDTSKVDTAIETPSVRVHVRAKPATAKVVLADSIKKTDGIKVTYSLDGKTVETELALSGDGKEIAVAPKTALTNGKTYDVTVECNGYKTATATFTAADGVATYEVKDFVCGDINGDGKIDISDFALFAKGDDACDFNRDGKADDDDLSMFNNAWEAALDEQDAVNGDKGDASLSLDGNIANRALTVNIKLDKYADLQAEYIALSYSDNLKFKDVSSLKDGFKGIKLIDEEKGRIVFACGKGQTAFDEAIASVKFSYTDGDTKVEILPETKLAKADGSLINYTAGELKVAKKGGKNITLQIGSNQIITDGAATEIDVPAQLINDRTMVPLRAIFEALGATVDWDDATETVTSVRDDKTVKLQIGSNKLYVNDDVKELDVPAQIVNDRTLVPVRAIAESFGCTVGWEEETETVTITE